MLPTSFIGSVIVGKTIFERGRNNLEQQMLFGVASVSQILNDWMEDHRLILKSISNDPGIKTLDPDTATEALKRHEDAIPNSALTLYKLDGEAVASNATPKPKNTKARKDDRIAAQWFKRATNGENGLGLWRRSNGTSCLKQSRGIYRGKELIGIIAKCTIPEDIAARSGIKKTVMLHGEQSSVATALNLDQGINTGIGVALVSRQKQIVLLHLEGQAATNGGQLLNPIESQKSRWIPIAEKIIQAKSKQQATILNINHFLVASVPINDEFILAFILNTVPFLETFLLAGAGVGLANLTALTISTIALTRISKPLLKPIDVAGDALRQMSEGDFGIALPESTNRDIQKLYGYIEASSSQLSTYFKEVTRNAATNSQLEQAKKLQSGFLVKELPGSQAFTISAMCQPAYEIGADWYDAFRPDCETDESIVIVVADVCDKGIGSALYMSVFRSLLRLSLLKEWESCQCCGTAIKAAVETVNEYMACNHGQDAMFATAFVAAYSPSTQVMHYVVAGHEPPIIQTNQELSQLKPSGPAIGVFPSASYQIHQCILQPGSIVLAFSDGLVDTRNETGESLGQQKVRSIMQEKDSQSWGAHELVERLNGAATTHRGKAEQFDDLTLMTLKIERLNNTKSKQI
ncbi:MAG: hypothetical protein CL862_09395 [Cyanobium sp. NAT70]|nr:hypothetical protein [Cyanobium sp. NAT70]|tara:strand:- start:4310 stop:6214 length:1905 start_codon:yes stop_codon:yes gene_type:complete